MTYKNLFLNINRSSLYSMYSDLTIFRHSCFTPSLIAKRFTSTKAEVFTSTKPSNKPVFGSLYAKRNKDRLTKPWKNYSIPLVEFANKAYFIKKFLARRFKRHNSYMILFKVGWRLEREGFTHWKMLAKKFHFTYVDNIDNKSLQSFFVLILTKINNYELVYNFINRELTDIQFIYKNVVDLYKEYRPKVELSKSEANLKIVNEKLRRMMNNKNLLLTMDISKYDAKHLT